MPPRTTGSPTNQIRRLRAAKGFSQVQLADMVGMSSQNLGRIEAGKVDLSEKHIRAFADALGVSPAELYSDEGPRLDLQMVPLISWVSAGGLAHASTSMLREVPMIPMGGLDAGEYFATEVRGDSMDRVSPEGSVIIVNRDDRRLIPGKAYVFAYRGETTYKLWFADPDQLAPFSLNPIHRPIYPRRDSDWEVVGRVRRSVLDFS